MNRKLILLAYSLFIAVLNLSAQQHKITGQILSVDSIAIPFASIYNQKHNIGCHSNEEGVFQLMINDQIKMLSISAIAYQTKSIDITDLKNKKHILLTPQTYVYEEVIVKPKYDHLKRTWLNKFPDKKSKTSIVSNGKYKFECGIQFLNLQQIKGELKSVRIYIDKFKAKSISYQVNIYDIDDDGKPASRLNKTPIIIKPKNAKLKYNTVNLEEYHFEVKEKGILVAVEWLMLPENKSRYKVKNIKEKREYYLPKVEVSEGKDEEWVMWSKYNLDPWTKNPLDFGAQKMIPKIELEINEYIKEKNGH